MNERIKELSKQAGCYYDGMGYGEGNIEKFAELIVEECRNVVTEVYRKTPLEQCGSLLAADEEIAKHFYGVEE
jgi:hypothetical protein